MRENQLRLRVLFLENANKVLREQMDRRDLETGELRQVYFVFVSDQIDIVLQRKTERVRKGPKLPHFSVKIYKISNRILPNIFVCTKLN